MGTTRKDHALQYKQFLRTWIGLGSERDLDLAMPLEYQGTMDDFILRIVDVAKKWCGAL